MDKASKMDFNSIVDKIMDNELGLILLEADENSIFDVLAKKVGYEDRQGMYGNSYHITYHLYPIMYRKSDNNNNLTRCRANAIHNIFIRWTDKGYNKRQAKSPYSCKAFNKYLDEIEYLKADYMLLMVE
ncbi:MAG: hypothetical protein VB106_05320 [Clostridiaceae bacterium]|nr:hypothetical protein [Clostridiaceae bacterium]